MYSTTLIATEPRFIMYKVLGTAYFFQFKTASGECILNSDRFVNRSVCLHRIVMVQKSAAFDNRYERKTTEDGRYYFLLRNEDGIVIGRGVNYLTPAGQEKAITELKKSALHAPVKGAA